MAAAVLVEPVDLPLAQQEDASEHQLCDAIGVHLRVRERQRRAPRAAEDLPLLNLQLLPNELHVGDEIPRGVVLERREGLRLAAPALIEQHDSVRLRVEEAALLRVGATTRPAVDEDDRLAVRVARLLVINGVAKPHFEEALVVRLNRRIQLAALGHGATR